MSALSRLSRMWKLAWTAVRPVSLSSVSSWPSRLLLLLFARRLFRRPHQMGGVCLARSWWRAACIVIGSFKDIRQSSDELRGWWKRRWRARSRASTSRPRRSTPSRRHSKAVIRAKSEDRCSTSTAGRIAAVPCLLRKSKRRGCTTYLCTTCCRSRAMAIGTIAPAVRAMFVFKFEEIRRSQARRQGTT